MPSTVGTDNQQALLVLGRIGDEVLQRVAIALHEVGMDIAAYGIQNAPIDHGFLRGSIGADPVLVTPTKLVQIIYAHEPYAIYQHEITTYRHPKGGEDHYLTRPLDSKRQQYIDRIKDAVRGGVEAARG